MFLIALVYLFKEPIINVSVQERFNEQGAGIEKLDGPDVPDGAQAWKQTVKKCNPHFFYQ